MGKIIKELVLIYKLLFYALTPIIICVLPVIPGIITNNGTWMFALFITIPLGTVTAMKYWEFPGLNEEINTNTTQEPKSKELDRIEL